MIAALALVAAVSASLVGPPAAGAAVAAQADCVVTEGAFTWGFKESFRAYISGSIANGEWTTEGGIGYETPAFFSEELEGSVALDSIEGALSVDGALRFTGHAGILDTTISNLRLVVENSERLVVVVDIRGTTQDFVPVDSVDVPFLMGDLTAAQWSAAGDALLFEDIPLTLTADGAEAFGTYPEGEAFDALTLSFGTTAECAAQAVDGRAAGGRVPLIIAAGVIAGGVGIGSAIAVVRRRRATMEA